MDVFSPIPPLTNAPCFSRAVGSIGLWQSAKAACRCDEEHPRHPRIRLHPAEAGGRAQAPSLGPDGMEFIGSMDFPPVDWTHDADASPVENP